MKDFYRILEVDRKASIDVIEKAYHMTKEIKINE